MTHKNKATCFDREHSKQFLESESQLEISVSMRKLQDRSALEVLTCGVGFVTICPTNLCPVFHRRHRVNGDVRILVGRISQCLSNLFKLVHVGGFNFGCCKIVSSIFEINY